ncbi:hypothetical protein [Streptomyces sp. NPDC050535]|uniref:hypothetical protein n=1 Tax=Streptomyces sp. NPDC050535 TaxID=3365626 RepID=UPI0037B0D614
MATAAVTLAVIAAVLEIGGIALTIRDIRAERRHLASYLVRPRHVYASDAGTVEEAMPLWGSSSEQTVEQRLASIEAWQRGLAGEQSQREKKLSDRLSDRFGRELTDVQKTLDDRLDGLREFVTSEGRPHWLVAYRGPLLLAVGVVAGLAANIVSAVQSS